MATLYLDFDPEELNDGPIAITIGKLGEGLVMFPEDPDPGEEAPEDEGPKKPLKMFKDAG